MSAVTKQTWLCHGVANRFSGGELQPVAAAGKCIGSGEVAVFDGSRCPWEGVKDATVVAFPAHQVLEIFRGWGWPEPANVIDLYAEYRVSTNTFSKETQDPDLQLALSRMPTEVVCSDSSALSREIGKKHCVAAVKGLEHLLRALPITLENAFQRGKYAVAVAAMQARGIPVCPLLRQQATALQERVGSGKKTAQQRQAARELASALRCPVDGTGRCRCDIRPYAAKTGRNQPRKAEHAWDSARFLISPPPGRVLAVIDYTAQEFGIAATLSNDPEMIADYDAGDAYLAFGRRFGLADRNLLKKALLPVMYGRPAGGLAEDAGISLEDAKLIEQAHHKTYSRFWRWTEDAKHYFLRHGVIHSVYGWFLHAGDGCGVPIRKRLRTVANFPVQANGTEMLWAACRLLHQAGIEICGVNHDAVMIETDEQGHMEAIVQAESMLADASTQVLGRPLRTDTELVFAGQRLRKGQRDWDRILDAFPPAEVLT